jgi:hypothetical protein
MSDNLLQRCDDSLGVIETGLATREEVLSAQVFVKKLGEIQRAIKARLDAAMIAWINEHGEIIDGEMRYYVGSATTRKCVDVPKAFRACIEASGGDLDAVLVVLSSGAFKGAAACKLLGDKAGEHFVTNVDTVLETGKPRKVLKSVNQKFLNGDDE